MKMCTLFLFTLIITSCVDEDIKKDSSNPIDDGSVEITPSHTIAQLFTDYGDTTIINDTIAFTGVIISNDEGGNIINSLFLKDETGALEIAIGQDNLFNDYPSGAEFLIQPDSMYLDEASRKLTFIDQSLIPSEFFINHAKATGNKISVNPEVIDIDEGLPDEYLANLVAFLGFQFPEESIGETFVTNNQQTIRTMRNENGVEISLVFEPGSTLENSVIPTKRGYVTGVITKIDDTNVLKVRDIQDLAFGLDRFAPFEKQSFSFKENTMPYQIMFPRDYDPNASYPLVIFLHGAGERGSDNERQMAYGPDTFGNYDARTDYPAIVIFPQCPGNVMWSRRIKYTENDSLIFEFPVEERPNYAMEMVIELVKSLIKNEAVDENRIYITGLSMGGIGVYEFFYYAPDIPAAGVSMAGGHDSSLVASYATDRAFWLHHGTNDGVVPSTYSKLLYNKMLDLGVNARLSLAEGRGHEWNYVLNDPEYLEWMFAQQK